MLTTQSVSHNHVGGVGNGVGEGLQEHSDSSLQCRVVVARHVLRNQCCFDDESGHATQYSESYVFVTWEAVDEEHAHGVHAECEGEPGGGIKKLFGG
jgi:hypothetical protein